MTQDTVKHWELGSQSQCRQFLIVQVKNLSLDAPTAGQLPQKLKWLSAWPSRTNTSGTVAWVNPVIIPVSLDSTRQITETIIDASDMGLLECASQALLSQTFRHLRIDWECRDTSELISNLTALRGSLARLPDLVILALIDHADPCTSSSWAIFLSEGVLDHPAMAEASNTALEQPSQGSPSLHGLTDLLGEMKSSLEGFHMPPLTPLMAAVCKLGRVIAHLRAPEGCPWDREQTIESLRPYLIEEAYEANLAAAKLSSSSEPNRGAAALAFADELGDVLLQIVLNAQLASEAGHFDFLTIVDCLTDKMIRRHPHVFAKESHATQVNSQQDVKALWEDVKAQEKLREGNRESGTHHSHLLAKAQKKSTLPTLDFATAISKRASKFGFCWPKLTEVWQDVESEVKELEQEVLSEKPDFLKVEDELGDVCFALANVLVHCKLHLGAPEFMSFDDALRKAIDKFIVRFGEMERIFQEENGVPLDENRAQSLDLDSWNTLWKKAKKRRYR